MYEQPVNYELLCRYLYDYRLGTITFLELLERIEDALNLRQHEKVESAYSDCPIVQREDLDKFLRESRARPDERD